MPWPLPKPAWLPRWLSTGDPHAHQAGPCRWVMPGVCREGSRCLFSQDLANSKHPASAGTGRRATAPVHSQVRAQEPLLRLVVL